MAVSDAINSGVVNLGFGAYNLWAGYDALLVSPDAFLPAGTALV